ncbi:unnamed protein product [Linum trigynum]|uniref:Uncharacterized protein n=1 Tax=Linum trigynum TaxID=586398 RepID=A0AAV2DE00_9ROSI
MHLLTTPRRWQEQQALRLWIATAALLNVDGLALHGGGVISSPASPVSPSFACRGSAGSTASGGSSSSTASATTATPSGKDTPRQQKGCPQHAHLAASPPEN